MNYRVHGKKELSGSVITNISKNAAVAMLCASLLNRGKTTLKRMPRIEELNRLVEVLVSIGVQVEWEDSGDMVIVPPKDIDLGSIRSESAERTRSIAMFIPALAHLRGTFELPAPGGCDLGQRSMGAHIDALAHLGIIITATDDKKRYHVTTTHLTPAEIIMSEASDTGVENVLMAAAKIPGKTIIKFASSNYMVQDLCIFLQSLGVSIEGIGSTTLTVRGVADINMDAIGYPSEDPIESMFFISLAATTHSTLSIKKCPIDFLELELLTLSYMGLRYERGPVYLAQNNHTRLVDLVIHASDLHAPSEKICARPYPGLNSDNLPFFVPIATQATGRTFIHDWMYEGRAIHYMEMKKLGADMILADPHRVYIEGPTPLLGTTIKAPPALRPATILLIGMFAAQGESTLINVYPINRGYERLHERLQAIGANIVTEE